MSDLDYLDDFTIDFGKAKKYELPEDGVYTFRVDVYELSRPKKDESAAHGFNIHLRLQFVDPPEGTGENFRVDDWIYFDVDNPFGAKPFFEAVTGMELESGEIDPRKPNTFIGETVRAYIYKESYTNNAGEAKDKMAVRSYLPA